MYCRDVVGLTKVTHDEPNRRKQRHLGLQSLRVLDAARANLAELACHLASNS